MISIRVVMPAKALLNPKALTQAIENGLDSAAVGIRSEFQRTVMTWDHKPKFAIDAYPGKRVIYTDDEIYGYVSGGTRPHIIRVKNAKMLHFYRTGFRAKSSVNSLRANQGKRASQDETFVKSVKHPGTAARDFDKQIQMRWKKLFPEQMQRAIDSEFGGL